MWQGWKVEIMPGVWLGAPGQGAIVRERHDQKLIDNLKAKMPELEELLKKQSGHWTYEDMIYRFYHQSFKVFWIQEGTLAITKALQELMPDRKFNEMFTEILAAGTGKRFVQDEDQTKDTNANWTTQTRPMVEAFFHAKYFLEMAVKYGKELEKAPNMLPSGWAAFLYLYDMR